MQKVRLTSNIWDNGEDCRPPMYLAYIGDFVYITADPHGGVVATHDPQYTGFFVDQHEYSKQLELF